MRKELIIASTMIFCLSILGCVKPPCFNCGKWKQAICGSCCKSNKGCNFEGCLLKVPCFAIMNKKELDLTSEQESKIKELCKETKKKHIKLEADIDILCVDLKSQLYENPINITDVDKLIDQKYELKKQDLKDLVQSLVSLKSILTKEQVEKLTELKKNHSKWKCCNNCN